jgi:hypothetical protein
MTHIAVPAGTSIIGFWFFKSDIRSLDCSSAVVAVAFKRAFFIVGGRTATMDSPHNRVIP